MPACTGVLKKCKISWLSRELRGSRLQRRCKKVYQENTVSALENVSAVLHEINGTIETYVKEEEVQLHLLEEINKRNIPCINLLTPFIECFWSCDNYPDTWGSTGKKSKRQVKITVTGSKQTQNTPFLVSGKGCFAFVDVPYCYPV